MKTYLVSSATAAEICKITDNTNRFVQINFANELQKVCWRFNVDCREIVDACNNEYNRNKIFTPGLGAYGFCLTKDPKFFAKFSYRSGMVRGALLINDWPLKRIAQQINAKYKTVAILGLAFKGLPPTDDTRFAPFGELEKMCRHTKFQTFDPHIASNSASITKALEGAEAVVILTQCKEFYAARDEIKKHNIDIIDPWSVLE
jgi:UDP-N-acetyl-D-mannosaminuronic acid dehydrogenase